MLQMLGSMDCAPKASVFETNQWYCDTCINKVTFIILSQLSTEAIPKGL